MLMIVILLTSHTLRKLFPYIKLQLRILLPIRLQILIVVSCNCFQNILWLSADAAGELYDAFVSKRLFHFQNL
jgi:hypothetical protein